MPRAQDHSLEEGVGDVSWSDVPGANALENVSIGNLHTVLSSGLLSLLRLSPPLEAAFRKHYRAHAARVLKISIYGLMALYLMVILPVLLLLPPDPLKTHWLQFAVYPIGIVLVALWLITRFRQLDDYVEQALGFSLFVCLVGTIYCAMEQGEAFFGHVAAYETIFIVIISFSILRLITKIALGWASAAFAVALLVARVGGMHATWLDMLLFYAVPLLICAVNGLMLEFAARRDFMQTLYHHQEKTTVLRDIAAAGNEVDDINGILDLTLRLLCAQRGWLAGQASLPDRDFGGMRSAALHISEIAGGSWYRGYDQLNSAGGLSLASQVMASGDMAWNGKAIALPGVTGPAGTIQTRFAFPIKLGNEVVAVIEFFSSRSELPNSRLRMLMEQVGHQLGHVFARKRRHQELLDRATHDSLTGLANRPFLLDRINAAMARSQRRGSIHFCVALIDVDRFKWINDSLGHDVGDQLLVQLSERLRRALRPSDVVARLGGDQFGVLMEDVDTINGAISAVQRLQDELRRTVHIDGHPVYCTGSIGIAMGHGGYAKPDEVLRDADTAMYHAKQRGRSGYVVFSDNMSRQNIDRLRLINELQTAIDEQQLMLYYQPIVSLASGVVTGFEALIRWQHPEKGMIGPGTFIPIAEESSLIIPLTRWVVAEACQQLARWQAEFPHNTQLSVSVNMSAPYFAQEGMPDEVLAIIDQAGIRHESLRLEITETQVMDNIEACMKNVRLLRDKGVYVYIDDFGTGYSSLNYLASFNARTLKIDQSFVNRLGEEDRETAIIRTITLLGQNLGMEVIAEGIETEDQLQFLQELGCEFGQGYFFARPMPADAAQDVIGKRLLTVPTLALSL